MFQIEIWCCSKQCNKNFSKILIGKYFCHAQWQLDKCLLRVSLTVIIYGYVRFQVLTAASMMMTHPWWWTQYAPLKRRSTIILNGSTSQETILNIYGYVWGTSAWNFCHTIPSEIFNDVLSLQRWKSEQKTSLKQATTADFKCTDSPPVLLESYWVKSTLLNTQESNKSSRICNRTTVHRPGDYPRKECEECGNACGNNVRYYPTWKHSPLKNYWLLIN
jgi:hypothetical protein